MSVHLFFSSGTGQWFKLKFARGALVQQLSLLAAVAAGLAVFSLDQWTKRIVLKCSAYAPIFQSPILQISGVAHYQKAFSRRGTRVSFVLLWVAALASSIVLVTFERWFHKPAALLGLALALGGAAGNLLDILRRGYILDFIDLRCWPVFNVADVGIVAGLLLAFWPGAGL
jgi:signal peptidase II